MMMRMKGTHARMTKSIALIAIVLLSLLQQGLCQDVVIKDLVVPAHVQRFSNVNLTCHYESEKVPLFIKWSHNNLEFFKFQPQSPDPMTVFDDDGTIKVIREQSTGETVVLKEVDLSASGNYTCIVIGEKPNFTEVNMTKTMTVVVIPDEQPRIEGDVQAHYAVGDIVNLTCTAPPSIPVATLSWHINGDKAPVEYLHESAPEKSTDGLSVAKLHLSFELSQSHFIKGELKLKCVASISTLYRESNEHSQQEPVVKNKEVRNLPEEGSLVTTGTSGCPSVLGSLSTTAVLPVMLLICIHLLH